jgi:hypothetical protein
MECTAGADDSIAPGDTRTFFVRMTVPSDVKDLAASRHLRSTAVVDPDSVIGIASEPYPPVVADTRVTGPSLQQLPIDSTVWSGSDVPATKAVSSLNCSGGAPFGHLYGSMTCDVSLHPANFQNIPVTLATGAVVAFFEIDNLGFNQLATDRKQFACSGSTEDQAPFDGYDEVPQPVLKLVCRTLAPLVFAPGDAVDVVTFSASVLAPTTVLIQSSIVDWEFCPIPPFEAGGLRYNLCVTGGGSAGD